MKWWIYFVADVHKLCSLPQMSQLLSSSQVNREMMQCFLAKFLGIPPVQEKQLLRRTFSFKMLLHSISTTTFEWSDEQEWDVVVVIYKNTEKPTTAFSQFLLSHFHW